MHHGRALRDQPWNETPYTAAADDFFDMAEQTFPAFDRPLRRPQIGFVPAVNQFAEDGFPRSGAASGLQISNLQLIKISLSRNESAT